MAANTKGKKVVRKRRERKNVEKGQVHITEVCAVAGLGGKEKRSGDYDYYIHEKKRDNDAKAVGPFILTALEVERLQGK